MAFTADPSAIKPGESTTLRWAVENPRTTTIEPAIGRAIPRGELRVTPTATTTYTLTVTGVNGTLTRTVTVTVAGTQPVAANAESVPLAARPAPRTADGKPDLTGVYGYGAGPGRGAPAPAAAPGELPRTPTLKPGAEKYRVQRGPTDTGLYSTCAPPGVPQTFFVPYYVQIIQAPKYLVILHEYLHLYRVIPLDGSPHPPDPDPFWMGHSTGRWEGDTLIVDSIGVQGERDQRIQDHRVAPRRRTIPAAESRDTRIRGGHRRPECVCRPMADHTNISASSRVQPRG
jgi:hypothetical protein